MSHRFVRSCLLRPFAGRHGAVLAALASALLGFFSPVAGAQSQNYEVDIQPELNGLDIAIEPVASSGMLVVNMTNNSPTRVRCKVNFDASPQTPSRSTHHIDSGKRESAVLRAQRRWFSVTVGIVCTPAPK
jgi:hypothetical protein